MDESWRMCMAKSTTNKHPPRRRKSMESANVFFTNHHIIDDVDPMVTADDNSLDADDFSDVFGGPPRSVLCRKLSGDFTRSASFYEEVFRPPEFCSSRSMKGGRILPAFRIPSSGEGFYSDIFRSDDDLRRRSRERSRSNSKAKSKSNSSSVLSSEELSPLRPATGDDVGLSNFASKLRPINVPSRWNLKTMAAEDDDEEEEQQLGAVEKQTSTFPSSRSFYNYNENIYVENDQNNNVDNFMRNSSSQSSYYGFCRRASSPEIISLEPHSFRSVKISADDSEFNNSPSSPASSLCQEPAVMATAATTIQQQQEYDDDDDDDEAMSSYVIEINSDHHRESSPEAVSIDEAIAWAKESYNSQTSDQREHEKIDHLQEGQKKKQRAEEKEEERSEEQIKMWALDEDVKLWSSGKENNIRFLLSTLHHILWNNSGWQMISLASLKESSQVKKAYQKARLCLHPDKLQQRGATISQKYVAEKAFSILQDAWATFISQDVFFN